MIVDKINAYLSQSNTTVNEHLKFQIEKLAGLAFQRQFMEEYESKPGVLRLSSAGKCPRNLAYKYHGFEIKGREIDSRAKIIFFQGDLVELMVMSLARLAGCNIVGTGFNQIKVAVPIAVGTEPVVVEGHPDGFLIDYGVKLTECKSMASFSYERFEAGEIDDGYRAQINMYLEGTGLPECLLVAMNKDNGVLGEMLIPKDPKIVESAKEGFALVLASTKDILPLPMYKADEKGIYPWQCLYCAYWGYCRPNAERVLIGRSYKLKEKAPEKVEKTKRM
jgi:hypothetical protein